MKRSIIILLTAALLFSVTGCSLPGLSPPSETQQDGTAAEINTNDTQPEDLQDSTAAADNTQVPASDETQGKKIEAVLYFATGDNSAVKKEPRELTVKDGAILRACVEALLDGPQTAGLRKTIPEGTAIRGINLKNRVAIVDFTKEYSATNGLSEVTARISVVNTLTGIKGVDKVRIMVEGKDLIGPSGKPLGDMGPAVLDAEGLPVPGEMKTITLYFGNSNADKVVAEKRKVEVNKGEQLEKVIFLELMKGPVTNGLHPVIPDGTRLLSVKTEDGLCTLDLSSEFVDNHPGGTAGESMTLSSIVNSLTELSTIKKVQFLIDGQKREVYTHAVFDRPFSRNTGMIGK